MSIDKCLVCGHNGYTLIYNKTLIKCKSCGFISANIEISENELKKIYSKNYFIGEEYLDYIRDKIIIQKNFKKKIEYIFKIKNKKEIKNVLEIGCAYGFFAEVLNQFIYTNYLGIDIVQDAIDFGKNILHQNLINASYLDINYPKNSFTDVFMWDVIEHLKHPDEFIKKISTEIKEGGFLYLTTGNISSILSKIKKSRWRLIHPPTHLYYFSEKTLKYLLNNHGFKVYKIKYFPVYRSIKQIFFSLFILNKKPNKIIKYIYSIIPENKHIAINTYDIMFLIAYKQ